MMAGCATGPAEPGDPEPEPVAAPVLAHAQASAALAGERAALQRAGWVIDPLSAATAESYAAPANPDDDRAQSAADVTWSRIRLAGTKAAAAGPLRIELLLAWSDGHDDQLAIQAFSDDAEAAAADAIVADSAPARPVETQVTFGSPCTSTSQCPSSLTCFGPDNHETCQCSSSTAHTTKYTSKLGTGLAGCSPAGAYHVVTSRTGCGLGLLSDACGNTRTVPSYVNVSTNANFCGTHCN